MIQNQFGEKIYSEDDLVDWVMQGRDIAQFQHALVSGSLDLETAALILENVPEFVRYDQQARESLTLEQFDHRCQTHWYMPQQYQDMDISAHILDLCHEPQQLQRVGQELLLYQERDLFDLLKYLKYLVDVMRSNNLIWGVGRGSSVASYVLYLLGVHRIDSLYYDLDPNEFLR
jgi:DNA polymerase III alpha subunit